MSTITKVFGLNPQEGEIGVEIEVEGFSLPRRPSKGFWRAEDDGSLKGESVEYVFVKPLSLADTAKALQSLEKDFEAVGAVNKSSYRAGVHVHSNVQDFTPRQVLVMGCCYFVLEQLFFEWFAPSRRGNHFCLSASDAEFLTYSICNAVKDDDLFALNTDDLRYSGLNFKSLYKYGSFEFRGLETPTDNFRKIYEWCEFIVDLKKFSTRFKTPVEVVESFSIMGGQNFLREAFGDNAKKLLTNNWQNLLRVGMSQAQDIAYCRDWGTTNYNIFRQTKGAW